MHVYFQQLIILQKEESTDEIYQQMQLSDQNIQRSSTQTQLSRQKNFLLTIEDIRTQTNNNRYNIQHESQIAVEKPQTNFEFMY